MQYLIVIVLLALAVAYAAYRIYRVVRQPQKACSECAGCPLAAQCKRGMPIETIKMTGDNEKISQKFCQIK